MVTSRDLAMLFVLTGSVLCASLFVCEEVNTFEEMADIRLGRPAAFVSVNMQRYTPLTFPQCFRIGSPWEDPMRVHWPALFGSFVIVFGSLLGIVWAAGPGHRQSVLYWMRWLALAPAVTAAFVGAGIAAVLATSILGAWEEAVAGFLCAVVVVWAAYVLAPKLKLATATAALLGGAVVAWHLVSPPSPRPEYDETSGITVGVPTYQSIVATYLGGVLCWVGCFVWTKTSRRSA